MLVGFEHVGMTTSDMDRAVAFYCDLLGLRLALRKPNGSGSELAFLDAGGGMLEIVAPAAGVGRFRDVPMSEAGMRHLTLAYDNVDAMIEKLEAAGVEIAERPRDAHNPEMIRRVAFVRDPDGVLVELIERAPGR
ncbi:VOC family protein [Devosia sp. XJ19-1]|uniref:VOC family protein n=1 Tax=Devosia ureilytica TaxID=2952754 RepID=A0A9Q4APN3_9HYPH|nr:VOC family protein [Devosia ureilytica]MCP8884209.1 VOC family protein [Devosia ureilytica]MCP8887817.1 VOC family protein [Devosia ureilytica]